MGSKQLAKQLLEQTKVPLTPGYHGSDQSEQALLTAARSIGYPVLLKAANGGGGKGMRAVHQEQDFTEALAGAKREALSSFADDKMIIEKLILDPRHVEVQIMADNFGQVVHLFERDCSIQRRHQKIIEEAPAPNLSPTLRAKLAAAACEVARSIDYRGAGTIEFLVTKDEQCYFMEMNTRLQVEHPVTEMITGLDLVAWQLKIAANEPLPLHQEQIKQQGHAVECRIYAEDPEQGFIPSIGRLTLLKEPIGEGIRIDTGVTASAAISQYYDPMIAKLIAWGTDRREAIQRLEQALAHYYIGGVKTNIPFLKAICAHPHFKEAVLSTHFLNKEQIEWTHPDLTQALVWAVSFDYAKMFQQVTDPLYQATFAWHNNSERHWLWHYQQHHDVISASIYPINSKQFRLKLNDKEYCSITTELQQGHLIMQFEEQYHQILVAEEKNRLTFYSNNGPITVERFSGKSGQQLKRLKDNLLHRCQQQWLLS